MSEENFIYDLFLSHAGEDTAWCETLAERMRNYGVRVWLDKWELQPGDYLLARLNDGLKKSRKMVAVWSASYFRDDKVWTLAENFAAQHRDILASDHPLIPLLIENCNIPPLSQNILYIDFRNPADFDLSYRKLLEALDLHKREFAREEEFEFREHEIDQKQFHRAAPRRRPKRQGHSHLPHPLLQRPQRAGEAHRPGPSGSRRSRPSCIASCGSNPAPR